MSAGGLRRRRSPSGRPAPGRLRLGTLLAVGEVVVLALLITHPDLLLARTTGRVTGALGTRWVTTTTTRPPSVPVSVPVEPTTPSATVPAEPTTPSGADPSPGGNATPPRGGPGGTGAAAIPVGSLVRGIVPPAIPPADIPPDPDFLHSCSGSVYDDSTACTDATLAAIANARHDEGLPALTLPVNWTSLTPAQQLFVVTDLERTTRGLAPLSAMAVALDRQAAQGAAHDGDAAPPAGFPATGWGSNWAGAVGNPLEADYLWMYDDGPGSANVDCTRSDASGCWGHRQNVLMKFSCQECLMGTAWLAGGYSGDPSLAELLVETTGPAAVTFTWDQELPSLR